MPRKVISGALALCTMIALAASADARDEGRWAGAPNRLRDWFAQLMQPDHPTLSCCGESDAMEADEWVAHADGSITATVTDGHGIFPEGMRVEVPAYKVKWDAGNPTGHSILFYGRGQVYCFVLDSLR